MKNIAAKYLLVSIALVFFIPVLSYGQMVVSKGWENIDSIRFEVHDDNGAGAPAGETDVRTKRLMDSLGVTIISSYGGIPANTAPYGTKRRGYDCYPWDGDPTHSGLMGAGEFVKQRIFYPSPERIGFWDDGGYRWRYIDTINYSWHNNMRDSNDVSPYAEFANNPTFVGQKYFSRMNNAGGDSMQVGTAGRLILGYNDQRHGHEMLYTHTNYPFAGGQIAKAFSARLEFNLDTIAGHIDTTNTSLSLDSIPLLRIQVLYKRGKVSDPTNSNDTAGSNILPFVPFKTTPYGSEAGWFKCVDTTITLKIWHTLRRSWRVRDTLENTSVAHDWNFKQLNLQIKNLPYYMIVDTVKNYDGMPEYAGGTDGARFKNIVAHPDSLVAIEDNGNYTNTDDPDNPYFEIRIFSTYRDTVRIRSLTWQDTLADKFLYRARFTGSGKDTTHSLNPNGSYGGFDDTMSVHIKWFADLFHTSGCTTRELRFNDVNPYLPSNSMSDVAYIEYLCSKYGIHINMRPQEGGEKTMAMRRERLAYDGMPPSLVENQAANTFSQHLKSGGWRNPNIQDVFPGDYIPSTSLGTGAWDTSPLDTMQGLIIARPGDSADVFKGYRTYTETEEIQGTIAALRGTANAALHHRKGRRTAWESSPAIWGGIEADAIRHAPFNYTFPKDTLWLKRKNHQDSVLRIFPFYRSHYTFRPTTPEENYAYFYTALANGASGFNIGQCFDNGGIPEGSSVTMFGISLRHVNSDAPLLDYSYNFGHRRIAWFRDSTWADANDNIADTIMPPYYLGYSNQFRATYRAMSRINDIYSSLHTDYPLKRFTWLDAYSTHSALSNGSQSAKSKSDSTTRSNAFLKCLATSPVKLWDKGVHGEYLDSMSGSSPVTDSLHRTYVEVGLFRDSSSTVNAFAAMIVNTRLYPDHKTGDDSIYYSKNLASVDRPHSLFGDIDVRKIWFKIDTNNFPRSFRTQYYVVRDIWHPDTTYLVKCDSNFAVYIKPGDAKFLYFEKGITIKPSPTAATPITAFAYNNGRRVAERMNETRDVVTYTRGGQLYVSYPSRGFTIPGYGEHSDADAIATGHEVCIDTDTSCHNPSICVARNDTGVAIVYWKQSTSHIHVAYQPHPDSGWYKAENSVYNCIDTIGYPVTPVCTPIDDSLWLVAATFKNDGTHTGGIIGARFRYEIEAAPRVVFISDGFTHLHADATNDTGIFRSLFPTVCSRPVPDSLWPLRMAWQKSGQIWYERIIWSNVNNPPVIEAPVTISYLLPSYCSNFHPSIANAYFWDQSATFIGPPPPSFSPVTLTDYVVWEAVIQDTPKYVSHGQLWPVLRTYNQSLNQTKGKWNRSYQVFKPDTTSGGARYPVVSAANRKFSYTDMLTSASFRKGIKLPPPGLHDWARIVWQNPDVVSRRIDVAHYMWGWTRGGMKERGYAPSLGQTTNDSSHMSHTTMVPRSTVFASTHSSGLNSYLSITNGWTPWVDTLVKFPNKLRFIIDTNQRHSCWRPHNIGGEIKPPVLIHDGAYITSEWSQLGANDPTIIGEDWAVSRPSPVEVYTDTFTVTATDSILIPRTYDVDDLTTIRNSLASSTDTLQIDFVLRKFSDSTILGVIERSMVTKDTIIFPGYGLNSANAQYKYPGGASTQVAFISLDVKRTQVDSLMSVFIEYEMNDSLPLESYKRGERPVPNSVTAEAVKVKIIPNPMNLTASVTVTLPYEAATLIELYDISGAKLQTLFSGEAKDELHLSLDGTNLSSGSYFLRVQSGSEVVTRKIQLLK